MNARVRILQCELRKVICTCESLDKLVEAQLRILLHLILLWLVFSSALLAMPHSPSTSSPLLVEQRKAARLAAKSRGNDAMQDDLAAKKKRCRAGARLKDLEAQVDNAMCHYFSMLF